MNEQTTQEEIEQVEVKPDFNLHSTDNEDDLVVIKYAQMAGGTAMQPIGAFRNIGLLKLQLQMLGELSSLHHVEYSEYSGKALLVAMISNLRAQHCDDHSVGTFFRLLPGFSMIKETLTFPILPQALTYAVGRVFQKHFELGGNLLNFSTTESQELFSDAYKEAKFILG